MSIRLSVKPWCTDCNEFEPCVVKDSYERFNPYTNEELLTTKTDVTCKHEQRCESMMNHLQTKLVQEMEAAKRREKEMNDEHN